jgi:hypothetical protein
LGLSDFVNFSLGALGFSFFVQVLTKEVVQPLLVERGLIQTVHTNEHFGFAYSSLVNKFPDFLIGICAYKLLPKTEVGLGEIRVAGGYFPQAFFC